MTDRDDLLRRVRRANPAPVGRDLPAGIAEARPPLEWLIEGKYATAATTRSQARHRGLIAAVGVAVVAAVVLAVLLWPRSDDPAPFVEEGSTIPGTTVASTTVAATEDPWWMVLSLYDSLVALSADEAWVSTGGDRLWHWEDGRASPLALPADLTGDAGDADLAVAPDGTLWAASANGVFSFDGTEWTRRFDGTVSAVAVAPDGTVWIGGSPCRDWDTWGRAPFWMARWDGESFTRVDRWQEVTSQEDFSYGGLKTVMAATLDGEVWIASRGYLASDLMRYDGRTMEAVQIGHYQDPWPGEATGPVFVFDIEAAPNGDIWIGGFVGGTPRLVVLARYDGAEWTEYDWPFANRSAGDEPLYFDLAVGPDGALWMSFAGGLGSYDGTTWSLRAATETWERHPGPVDVAPDGTVWYSDGDGLHTLTP